jgi:hypothetical protein
MTETVDKGYFTDVADTQIYSVFTDEPSNRLHFEIARGGNIYIVDIQGWFRDIVPMPGVTEQDAL